MKLINRFLLKIFFFLIVMGLSSLAYANLTGEVNTNEILSLIAQQRGKVVLLNFWASWCPYCIREIRELKELRKKISPQKLAIIGISLDTSEDAYIRFVKKSKINYPTYRSVDASVGYMFNIVGIPITDIYGRDGRLLKRFNGYVEPHVLVNILMEYLKDKD